MAFKMTIWRNQEGNLVEIAKNSLDKEQRLEEWIEKDVSLIGLDILLIGRQVSTPYGGRIDLLGIDSEGDIVILELKRDRTPREIVAQVLDYASWINDLSAAQIGDIAAIYLKKPLNVAFRERFAVDLPDAINDSHRMLIVASQLDDSSERIVQYLSTRHSLDINVVFFTCFKNGNQELVGRAWLLDPEEVEVRSSSRHRLPWSGYWFVNIGEDDNRSWEDCRKYGFLASGYGKKYSLALERLKPGCKVFAYLKKTGYLGYGEVVKESVMARDFIPEGENKVLLDLDLTQKNIGHDKDNVELAEYVVGIRWSKTFTKDQAKWFEGAFANQHIVCKLRDQKTIDFLRPIFEEQK